MTVLRTTCVQDFPVIDDLIWRCFGSGRFVKAAQRLREGNTPVERLSWVVVDLQDRVLASIQYWPVEIGENHDAVLLGPLVVDPAFRNQKLGKILMTHTLELARQIGLTRVILVGDAPYYEKMGFTRQGMEKVTLEHPVRTDRLLGCALVPEAFNGVEGMVRVPRVRPALPDFIHHEEPLKTAFA